MIYGGTLCALITNNDNDNVHYLRTHKPLGETLRWTNKAESRKEMGKGWL